MDASAYPDAATLHPRPILVRRDETVIYNGGYGSSFARHPRDPRLFYLLTDRGPNYEMTVEDQKTFPLPGYTPRIGLFRLDGDRLMLQQSIPLLSSAGDSLTGIPNPAGQGGTGETPLDTLGSAIAPDPDGVDPEGLAPMSDGTFWVSDEYGPHLLHLGSDGRTLQRLSPSPGTGSLPAVLRSRRPNRGFENLAVTPDQRTLVAMLESPLDNPREDGRRSRLTRLILVDLESGTTKQFAYRLDDPELTVNGMAALTGTRFLVLERDDRFPGDSADPSRAKRVYRLDLEGATDLTDPSNDARGRLFQGKTLEQLSDAELARHGVVPVTKSLVLDLLEPALGYPHNKPEGLAVIDSMTIAVANDDDFGITDDGRGGIVTKMLPLTGTPDATTVRFFRLTRPLY